MSAARLWRLAEALEVPVSYFYEGFSGTKRQANGAGRGGPDLLARKETHDLVRAYYALSELPRRRLLDLSQGNEW